MKIKVLSIIVIVIFISCSSNRQILIKNLYRKQKGFCTCAISAKWSREQALKNGIYDDLFSCDTLWMIETINEIDKQVSSSVWNCSRNIVFNYSNRPDYECRLLEYVKFADPLKLFTEKFDTTAINNRSSYFGANYVFISQIIKGKFIRTYYFKDITPISYFK